jgi:hypothetical protein
MAIGYESDSSDDVGQMLLRLENMNENQPELDQSLSMTELKDEELLNKDELEN